MSVRTYTTIAGDTWDGIAYKLWGNEYKMTDLQRANTDYLQTVIFDAGVVLTVPEIQTAISESLPPWKR